MNIGQLAHLRSNPGAALALLRRGFAGLPHEVSIGLYGVLATFVSLRTAEIGVRIALGATPSNILRLVVGHGLSLSTVGIAAGIVAAIGLTRFMTTMLVSVPPTDPVTFLATIALFLAIAAISCWIPARRAA